MSGHDECAYITQTAQQFALREPARAPAVTHIDNYPAAAWYVHNADQIAHYLPAGQRVLDWGCGFGHMAWLLANRGYRVSACDMQRRPEIEALLDDRIHFFPLVSTETIHVQDNSFDAVVSSGTLEHAENIVESLREIKRILKPGGWFFIFRFPNHFSIVEYLCRKRGIWSHSVLMTIPELRFLLRMFSFNVVEIGYGNFLPNLQRGLRFLRPWRERFYRQVILLDTLLTRLPLIATFSTSIYCFARSSSEFPYDRLLASVQGQPLR